MAEIKIKVTKSENFNEFVHPHIATILEGKLAARPYESVLVGACEDIKSMLKEIILVPFRYEKTPNGHFFYLEEADFEKARPAFTIMFLTNVEIN